jgi:ABC-type polysaccharide/polyol phosphate export permease
MEAVLDLWRWRTLLLHFVRRDLRVRYIGSVMGVFWSVIHPIALLVIFTLVFSVVLGVRFRTEQGVEHYALYLLCGMLPWLAFQEGVIRSTSSLANHSNLIKKVRFPTRIIPLYICISQLVHQLVGVGVLLIAILIIAKTLHLWILAFPVLLLTQLLFTVGLGWLLAAGNAYLRDLTQVANVGMVVWMYLTPVVYPTSAVPAQFQTYVWLNPMSHLVYGYRAIFLDGLSPFTAGYFYLVMWAVALFMLGLWVFHLGEKEFADIL